MIPEHCNVRFRTVHTEFLWEPAKNKVSVIASDQEPLVAKMEAMVAEAFLNAKQEKIGGSGLSSLAVLKAYFADTQDPGIFEILEAIPATGRHQPKAGGVLSL